MRTLASSPLRSGRFCWRLLLVLALLPAMSLGNARKAQAGCCWDIYASMGISTILLTVLQEAGQEIINSLFNISYKNIFQSNTRGVGNAYQNAANSKTATAIQLSDRKSVDDFRVAAAGSLAKIATEYRPSRTACVAQLDRQRTLEARARAGVRAASAANRSTAYLSGSDPATVKGPIAAVANQFNSVSTQFFPPHWRCPAGVTCNALPAATGGTLGGKHLVPGELLFGVNEIPVGSNEEKAANAWITLVAQPIPPAARTGDQLALPAARTAFTLRRSDILSVNIQRTILNEGLTNRLTNSAAGPPEASVQKKLYDSLANPEMLEKKAMLLGQQSQLGNIQAIGAEVDRLNYAYWQLFQMLEKIALSKALEMKNELDKQTGFGRMPAAMGGI